MNSSQTLTLIPERGSQPARPRQVLRLQAVEARTGLKKSSIYSGVKGGTFPAPVKLSARLVGWHEEVIDRWLAERQPVVLSGGSPDIAGTVQ